MNHAIDHLAIHWFRGLRDLELNGLRRVNLFVGPNNSGKTTVLEAISVFCQPLDVWAWLGAASLNRETPPAGVSMAERVRWLFPNDNWSQIDSVRITGEGLNRNLEVRGTSEEVSQFANPSNGDTESNGITPAAVLQKGLKFSAWIEFLNDSGGTTIQRQAAHLDLWENAPVRAASDRRFSIPTEWVNVHSHLVRSQTPARLGQAFVERRKDSVLEMIQHFDANIRSVEVVTTGGPAEIYIDHENLCRPAPLMTFGGGLQRILDMALAVEAATDGVLLIDELEVGIHRDVLGTTFPQLVEACRLRNVQLFATTHSLEAIDAILPAREEDCEEIAVFRLGHVDHRSLGTRIAGERLHDLRYGGGLDVR